MWRGVMGAPRHAPTTMAFGDSDLFVFLADFGEDVTWNGVTVTGVVDLRDALQPTADPSMQAAVAQDTVVVRTIDWPGIDDGETVTVRGQSYLVTGTPLRLAEGAFKRLALMEVTS